MFALNGNKSNPDINGIGGILAEYRKALAGPQPIKFGGQSKFSEIFKWTNTYAKSLKVSQTNQQYCVLVLITDGSVDDMKDAVKEIVVGSELPISIVIVGVGSGDFSAMRTLDADDGLLKSPSGTKAKRDIVSFIPYRQYFVCHFFLSFSFPYFLEFQNFVKKKKGKSMQALASACLGELPGQLLEYMQMHKINPKKLPVWEQKCQ